MTPAVWIVTWAPYLLLTSGVRDWATRCVLPETTLVRKWASHGMPPARVKRSFEAAAACSLRTPSGITFCSTARQESRKASSLTLLWCAPGAEPLPLIGPRVQDQSAVRSREEPEP